MQNQNVNYFCIPMSRKSCMYEQSDEPVRRILSVGPAHFIRRSRILCACRMQLSRYFAIY